MIPCRKKLITGLIFFCFERNLVNLHYPSEHLQQWFLNFFERDPNLSFMNISRPKTQTSKKCIFSVSNLLLFLQICMK